MRSLTILLSLICVTACQAQSLADYLKLRHKHHIVQPIGSIAFDGLTGTKVVELDGTVEGSFGSKDVTSIIFQRPDGEQATIECKTLPDWLTNGDTAARLLVRVSRNTVTDPLVAELLQAQPEGELRKIDEKYWRAEAAKAPKRPRSTSLASRSGSIMYGEIGHSRSSGSVMPASQVTRRYAQFILSRNRRLSDEQAIQIAEAVIGYSNYFDVNARLVMAMLIVESDFDPRSTSNKGAMGLGQLMPGTAQWMGVSHPYDTTENIYGTIKLLATLIKEYQSQTRSIEECLRVSLAAYNAGEGAVRRHGGVPPYRETQAYVERVMAFYRQLISGDR